MSENPNPNGPDDVVTPVVTPDDGGQETPKVDDTFKAITSQADFDAAIQKRIARVTKQYEGFDDIKAKAENFDKLEAEKGSEIEKAQRRAEKAERERDDWKSKHADKERNELVADIGDELKLPKHLRKRVSGTTDDEIRADVADLMSGLPSTKKDDEKPKDEGDSKPPSQAPKQKMTFTATGDESDQGLALSADEILKQVPRGGGNR